MFVIVSWVSFLIKPEVVPGRSVREAETHFMEILNRIENEECLLLKRLSISCISIRQQDVFPPPSFRALSKLEFLHIESLPAPYTQRLLEEILYNKDCKLKGIKLGMI